MIVWKRIDGDMQFVIDVI